MDTKYHYGVIERALREIDAGGPALTLEALADRMGMSAAHFQRIFSAWVGVSPKRYQQYLTLDHARNLLADRFTVLDTALSTGLSGPSRLHDLFLTWEAMSPGDYARGGAGLRIAWGWFDTPFGPAVVMGTHRGICGMGLCLPTGGEDLGHHLGGAAVLRVLAERKAAVDQHLGTAAGKSQGAGPADALTSTGDDGDLTAEVGPDFFA